jgi:hypothetical protein
MSSASVCNCCGTDEPGLYTWECAVCRGKLCETCEDEQDASNHSIRYDPELEAETNPDCPFCSFRKPVVRSPQDAELAAVLEYACSKLGTTYDALHDECFGDRGFAETADTTRS